MGKWTHHQHTDVDDPIERAKLILKDTELAWEAHKNSIQCTMENEEL